MHFKIQLLYFLNWRSKLFLLPVCYPLYIYLNIFDTLCFGIVFAGPHEHAKTIPRHWSSPTEHVCSLSFFGVFSVRKIGLSASFLGFLAPKSLNHGYQKPKVWRAFLKSSYLATENGVSLWTRGQSEKKQISVLENI